MRLHERQVELLERADQPAAVPHREPERDRPRLAGRIVSHWHRYYLMISILDNLNDLGTLRGMSADRAIEVEGLVREFKKGPRAVDGIDLFVLPGEIYGFLGPNGAGKSTTVLMLTTLLPPTAGVARVGGFDVVEQGPEVRGVIGAALQEAALDPVLTGREHLRLQGALHGLSRRGASLRAPTRSSSGSGSPRPPTARWAATPAA